MTTTIDEALTALVRKYPDALTTVQAVDFLAASTGHDRAEILRHVSGELEREDGSLDFDDDSRLTLPGAVPNPRRPPLPLTSPDGRVFGWACAHCLAVGGAGCSAGGETPDARRAATARLSLEYAERCGVCMDCKAFRPDHADEGITCDACLAALRARQPKGAMVPCDDCKGTGEIGVERAGEALSVQCPTCEGDGQVWRAEP